MISMRTAPLALVVVASLATGCGTNPVDSKKVWRSVQRSLGAGDTTQALSASFTFEVDCERGGGAELTAGLDIDDTITNALSGIFGYEIRYDECQPDENTLDGELDYRAALLADATDTGGQLTVRTQYQGVVNTTGATTSTCEIDVEGTFDAAAYEDPGEEFHGQVDMTYTGTICGNAVDEVFSAKADVDADDT
jgi:hypothetical protein